MPTFLIWLKYLDLLDAVLRIAIMTVAGHQETQCLYSRVEVNLQQDARSLVHRVLIREANECTGVVEGSSHLPYLSLPALARSSLAPTPLLFLHYIMSFS